MDEIQRYAFQNGIEVQKWIKEIVSGKKLAKGRKLGTILKKLKKGDTLIVTEISRLSRSLTDIMGIVGDCVSKGVSLYTTKEKYHFDDSINSKVLCFAFGLDTCNSFTSFRTPVCTNVMEAGSATCKKGTEKH